MGILYTAVFDAVAVTAVQDLFELNCPAARSVIVHRVAITQGTEIGDAQAEMLRFALKVGATTSGSGGSTVTPRSNPGGVSFSGTVEANNTTRATGGTIVVLETEYAHVANGWYYEPVPRLRQEFEGGTRVVIGLETAPTDSVTLSGVLDFEVIGGI